MPADPPRNYHHGQLERAGIDGAVEEVETVGVAAVSMRRIARRAGVSHAALAYKFGDKAGIFTAVAAEGFRIAAEKIGAVASGPDGFVRGGQTYIEFALTHRGYFEVMFRPKLYRGDDEALAAARTAAFGVLYGTARASLEAYRPGAVTEEDVRGLVLAGWSASHGFATLALTANLSEHLETDAFALAAQVVRGIVIMGQLAQQASGD
ncbi:TetR family transcriptional regulator [Mycobacterium sp. 20KCMC460]|uniref:TetR family transcriptional regulator n=1 Tax=Mycobacterium kiyosense TaxID=2871094 RepID=A0A9P3Q078_9MYCO|nr:MULTISPECIES: TetR/AcrR family transcriptional regulator [Mycobacterium]BDE14331.1 TetR family transcriptional regulator [Mycobacterium sp. 20KCMC460]GLB81453.1 TetR family transcriptional regulator [Mycobacterium kiyosense]GLB93646.1 TetR family transcriptional regulator [Mycobacterium kiyosense]GLD28446.1 TetR family transcriptional regulator [Mycobacterium kiyosense]GLD34407.1 TetR family transcriptional regulator [Mycobacterium kiyosense]